MNSKVGPILILVVIVVAIAVAAFLHPTLFSGTFKMGGTQDMTLTSELKYLCDGGKTINAAFYQGKDAVAGTPGTPPKPDGKVVLTLADGTTQELSKTISADGVRYANKNESFVFWTRGPAALVLQDNQEGEYKNCFIGA